MKSKTPVPSGRAPPPHKEVSPAELSKASSFHNKDSEKSVFGRVNSPALSPISRNLSGHTMRSQLLSSSMKGNTVKIALPKTGYTKQIQESLESDRSEIKSLDELFSEGADTEDTTSSSLKCFRPNVMSLDDLAPDTTNKQDYLNQNERTLNSEYSEDFERSLSTADGESVEGHAESCTCSGAHPSSASSLLVAREQHSQGHQVTVTETAVQTAEPPFTYCWAKANPSAGLTPPVGTSYFDPVPIASHVSSMDAVEALTTYSPSLLVLHTMCKQHVMLTQQFVKNLHHLHTSLVELLEHEKFHYHTLEEAKEGYTGTFSQTVSKRDITLLSNGTMGMYKNIKKRKDCVPLQSIAHPSECWKSYQRTDPCVLPQEAAAAAAGWGLEVKGDRTKPKLTEEWGCGSGSGAAFLGSTIWTESVTESEIGFPKVQPPPCSTWTVSENRIAIESKSESVISSRSQMILKIVNETGKMNDLGFWSDCETEKAHCRDEQRNSISPIATTYFDKWSHQSSRKIKVGNIWHQTGIIVVHVRRPLAPHVPLTLLDEFLHRWSALRGWDGRSRWERWLWQWLDLCRSLDVLALLAQHYQTE
ncbi:hypothetical protein IHE44_0010053 [Lamprotornis superbus]|uniref:DUF4614 domain-containing protein n=1 Tax=Lamprotornis superbus TaxID=245042 RepID=A0A835NHS4_9PASS|nr:hypothetical protein IHE44_0010053 [Lamprotornis superbus]